MKLTIILITSLLILLSGCAVSQKQIVEIKSIHIPIEKRNIYINEVEIDTISLKQSMTEKIFNSDYLYLTVKDKATSTLTLEILKNKTSTNRYKKKYYDRTSSGNQYRYRTCFRTTYILNVLAKLESTKIDGYKIFKSSYEKDTCDSYITTVDTLEELALNKIVSDITTYLIPSNDTSLNMKMKGN